MHCQLASVQSPSWNCNFNTYFHIFWKIWTISTFWENSQPDYLNERFFFVKVKTKLLSTQFRKVFLYSTVVKLGLSEALGYLLSEMSSPEMGPIQTVTIQDWIEILIFPSIFLHLHPNSISLSISAPKLCFCNWADFIKSLEIPTDSRIWWPKTHRICILWNVIIYFLKKRNKAF